MRTTSWVLALGCMVSLGGCGAPPSTRAVSGELRVDTSTMNHPVVLAESSDHRVFVAEVTASGHFTLQLPPSVSYRLTLATATRSDGIFSAVARINWPLESGAARWATLNAGAALDLGLVFKRGSKSVGHASSSSGGDSAGACHEDDHAGCQSHDSDFDCDCDHHYSSDDHCDGDGDAAEHDHDCDDDDHHKCNGDGGSDDHGGGGARRATAAVTATAAAPVAAPAAAAAARPAAAESTSGAELPPVEIGVDAAGGHQLVVRAALDDRARRRSTRIRSALRIVLRRCAMTTLVRPASSVAERLLDDAPRCGCRCWRSPRRG